jgi:quercetin dioxygenase-like cupin family protein
MSQILDTPEPQQSHQRASDMIEFDLRTLATFRDDRPAVTMLSDIGTARIVLFTFKAGQELREHHTSSQILVQVLRGRISFTAVGRTLVAHAGTLLQLEGGVRHSLSARTNAVVLVTMVPSPSYHSLEQDVFANLTPLVARAQDS